MIKTGLPYDLHTKIGSTIYSERMKDMVIDHRKESKI